MWKLSRSWCGCKCLKSETYNFVGLAWALLKRDEVGKKISGISRKYQFRALLLIWQKAWYKFTIHWKKRKCFHKKNFKSHNTGLVMGSWFETQTSALFVLENQYGGLNVLWNCSTCLKKSFNISSIVHLVWIVYIALPSNVDNVRKDVPFVNSIIYVIEN